MTYSSLSAYDLGAISFIAGTEQELIFNIYTSASVAMDLSDKDCTWEMARFGSASAILTKTASVSGSPVNRMIVILESDDTASFSGKYIQQPVITSGSSEYRPSQGVVQIYTRIS